MLWQLLEEVGPSGEYQGHCQLQLRAIGRAMGGPSTRIAKCAAVQERVVGQDRDALAVCPYACSGTKGKEKRACQPGRFSEALDFTFNVFQCMIQAHYLHEMLH